MHDLSRFPRIDLIGAPTPIQPLDGLSRHLGDTLNGVRLFVKRDDLGPVGGGGNKLRKLEFLLGQARADGVDTVITVGALQSNHARLTAAATARCGFRCELFLTRSVPRDDADYTGNGNRLLHELFGARVHLLPGDADSLGAARARAAALEADGRRVAVFPSGGSSPLGCLGYVACAAEILEQSATMGRLSCRRAEHRAQTSVGAGFLRQVRAAPAGDLGAGRPGAPGHRRGVVETVRCRLCAGVPRHEGPRARPAADQGGGGHASGRATGRRAALRRPRLTEPRPPSGVSR